VSVVVVRADTRRLPAVMRRLGDRAPVAARRALNKTLDSARAHAVRTIAADLALRGGQAPVRRATGGTPATEQELTATLRISDTWIPALKAPGAELGRARLARGRVGVSPAFRARMPSGHRGWFKRIAERGRRGKPYLQKIAELFTERLPALVRRRQLDEGIRRHIAATLEIKLRQETAFILRGRVREG
jgi:hypothetical protein